jgi:hypothetical protein
VEPQVPAAQAVRVARPARLAWAVPVEPLATAAQVPAQLAAACRVPTSAWKASLAALAALAALAVPEATAVLAATVPLAALAAA